MDQKRIKAIFLLIVLFQNMAAVRGEDLTPSEGDKVKIYCTPEPGAKPPLVVWFRVVQNRVEFIGSFNSAGADRKLSPSFGTLYSSAQVAEGTLMLKAFSAARDGGAAYSCASMRNNALQFGKVTRFPGAVKPVEPVTPAPARPTAKAKVSPVACNCPNSKPKQLSIVCQPVILGSLAGGCGLLLLLLIATIIHCNRIRTRRCPHHYKRQKQRKQVESKHEMEN